MKGWKNSIDDIKIICKRCARDMVLESSLNGINGIFVCNNCREHLNIGIRVGEDVREIYNDKGT